jgi:hypothetical protein
MVDFSDRDTAENSKACLRYMESHRGLPAQEAACNVTMVGAPSLTDQTLADSALPRAQQIDEIHSHHHAVVPTKPHGIDGREASNVPLYLRGAFLDRDPFDKEAPFAQPMGKEHEH